jgi:hypothetical protein
MENNVDFSSLQDKSGNFEIKIDADYFKQNDILISVTYEAKVISAPKKIDKWWMKVLRFLTFGKYFKPYWVYDLYVGGINEYNKFDNK